MWEQLKNVSNPNAQIKVGIFAGCAQDFIYPETTGDVRLIPLTEPEIRRLMLLIAWPQLMDVEKALV
jgi:hypothetical protein